MEQVLKGMNKVLVGRNGTGTLPYLSLNELLKQQAGNQAPPAQGSGSGSGQ